MNSSLQYTVSEDVVNAKTGETAWFVRGLDVNERFERPEQACLFASWMNLFIWGDLGAAQ